MPSESPTSTTSTPAASSTRAKLASYAVSATIFSPATFICRSRGTVSGVRLLPLPVSPYMPRS
ncbi:hypothetical protein D3C83_304670 [compost metagenome]